MEVGTEPAEWAGTVQAPENTLFHGTPPVLYRRMMSKEKMAV